jgi:hypothetical protein
MNPLPSHALARKRWQTAVMLDSCWTCCAAKSRADWMGTEGKKQEMGRNKSERAVPETRFELVGNIEEFDRQIRENIITVGEAAKRISLRPKTLYCWIEKGTLRVEHGLLRLGGKSIRIDWAIFKACLDRGEFAGSSASCS